MNKINEKHMSDTFDFMLATFKTKNANYGNSFEASLDKYGAVTALARIGDKFSRIEHLLMTGNPKHDDEPVLDTLLDMANYCIMTAVYYQNYKGAKHHVEDN